MVAMIIAILAVVGLAYSFGLGRSFINRFEIARAALAVAQQRHESLFSLPRSATEFDADSIHVRPFSHGAREVGEERWQVTWYNDPSTTLRANDLKLVTVTVRWLQGSVPDSVNLSRLYLP